MLDSPVQPASSQVASGAQLTSCTAWRQDAVAQAVQIPKQTPEGSCWGLLDSPEHTDSSQPAFRVPLWPLAGPGDVVLQPRLFWIPKRRSEGSHQRSQDWNLRSVVWIVFSKHEILSSTSILFVDEDSFELLILRPSFPGAKTARVSYLACFVCSTGVRT